jgi:hypothetical protein
MQALFEPVSKTSDSLSYDITAWSLPFEIENDKRYELSNLSEGSIYKIRLDDPYFMAFWESGRVLLGKAVLR